MLVSRPAKLLRASGRTGSRSLSGARCWLTTPKSRRLNPWLVRYLLAISWALFRRSLGYKVIHPLAPYLSPFRKKRRGERGVADNGLVALLELRNGLGHDLAWLSEARARSILTEDDPESRLVQVLDSLEGMLSCPLSSSKTSVLSVGKSWPAGSG